VSPSTSANQEQHWRKFGLWLREQRMARAHVTGKRRYELAQEIGVGDNTFANWERGGRKVGGNWVTYRPTDANLVGIARVLGIPIEEVFKRAGVKLPAFLLEAAHNRVPTATPNGDDMLRQLVDLVTQLDERIARLEKAGNGGR
jgi:transcriptional regulator with XRE-family HTH domain